MEPTLHAAGIAALVALLVACSPSRAAKTATGSASPTRSVATTAATTATTAEATRSPMSTRTPPPSPTAAPTATQSPTAAATASAASAAASPTPIRAGLDWQSIAFRDAQHGWVGGNGVILATADGGTTWSRQYDGALAIEQLHFLTDADGWAVGDKGLLRTTDGGATWLPAKEPPRRLHQIAVLGPTLILGTSAPANFTAGDSANDHLYASHDGGRTWTEIATPIPVGGICFVDAEHGWAVNAPGAVLPALLETSDGGVSWQRLPFPPVLQPGPPPTLVPLGKPFTWPYPPYPRQTLGCFGFGVLWDYVDFGPVGAGGGEAYVLARSTDGGHTWRGVVQHQTPWLDRSFAPAGGLSVPGELDAVTPDTAYLPGACFNCGLPMGKTSVGGTTDGGRTWHVTDIPGLPASGTALDFLTPERGWLVARQDAAPARSEILATTDGGRTWTQQYPPTAFRSIGAWFADAAHGWITGQHCQEQPAPGASGPSAASTPPACLGMIEATTDGGRSWNVQYADAHDVSGIQFVDVQTGWAIRSQGARCPGFPQTCPSVLMVTHDGQNWTDLYRTPLSLDQLAFTSKDDGWLLGQRCADPNTPGTCEAHVLVTTDGGHSWRDTLLPVHATLLSLSHPTVADGWVVSAFGGPPSPELVASHDGGRTWQSLPDPGLPLAQSLFFRTAQQGWLLSGGEPGAGNQMKELFGTTDGGHTWTKLAASGSLGGPGTTGSASLPTGGYVGDLVFSIASDGWIASPRGSLLHSTDGGKTWQPAPIDAHYFTTVGFATPQVGWAVSVEGEDLWLTDDGGRTWHSAGMPQPARAGFPLAGGRSAFGRGFANMSLTLECQVDALH